MIAERIGAKLRELRTRERKSIISLAESLGVPSDCVHRWESGAERVPARQLIEITQLFGCNVSDFVIDRAAYQIQLDTPASAEDQQMPLVVN